MVPIESFKLVQERRESVITYEISSTEGIGLTSTQIRRLGPSKETLFSRWENSGKTSPVTIVPEVYNLLYLLSKNPGINSLVAHSDSSRVQLKFPFPRPPREGKQNERRYGEVHALAIILHRLLGGGTPKRPPLTLEKLNQIKNAEGLQIEISRNPESDQIEKITVSTKPNPEEVFSLTIKPDLTNPDVKTLVAILDALFNHFKTDTLGSIE